MDNASKNQSSWTLPIALSITGVAGFFLGKLIKNEQLNPSDILSKVKKYFLAEGPIEGSWIESKPITFQRFAFKTTAYKGGITRLEDGHPVSYQFLADTHTGTVLNIERI